MQLSICRMGWIDVYGKVCHNHRLFGTSTPSRVAFINFELYRWSYEILICNGHGLFHVFYLTLSELRLSVWTFSPSHSLINVFNFYLYILFYYKFYFVEYILLFVSLIILSSVPHTIVFTYIKQTRSILYWGTFTKSQENHAGNFVLNCIGFSVPPFLHHFNCYTNYCIVYALTLSCALLNLQSFWIVLI